MFEYFITRKVLANFGNIEENFDLDSYQSKIALTLSENVINSKVIVLILVNKITDWEGFRGDLKDWSYLRVALKFKYRLEEQLDDLIKPIQEAAWNNNSTIKQITKRNGYSGGKQGK